MAEHVEASATVSAAPETLWDLVSDVTRMSEWAPETVSCEWLDGVNQPLIGARFRGENEFGDKHRTLTCEITESAPGRRFQYVAKAGRLRVGTWTYDFDPQPDGSTVVTESIHGRKGLVKQILECRGADRTGEQTAEHVILGLADKVPVAA